MTHFSFFSPRRPPPRPPRAGPARPAFVMRTCRMGNGHRYRDYLRPDWDVDVGLCPASRERLGVCLPRSHPDHPAQRGLD